MQQLMSMSQGQTMTSKEIAELTGREHDSVLRSVRNIHDSLPADLRTGILSTTYVDVNGKSQPMFSLDKNAVLCLISGYDITGRMRIIRRWQELEDAQKQLLPQTHIEAVRAYLVTLETVEAQQKELGMQQQVITKQDETIEEKKIITDDSDIYFSTQRLSSLFYPIKFDGRVLSRKSEEMQIDWQEQHTPFKSQQPIRVYHYAVVEAAYGVDFGY